MIHFNWSIIQKKKLKLRKLPKIILCEDGVPPIWLIYISEKERPLGKGCVIKWVAIGNTIRNTLRTWGT